MLKQFDLCFFIIYMVVCILKINRQYLYLFNTLLCEFHIDAEISVCSQKNCNTIYLSLPLVLFFIDNNRFFLNDRGTPNSMQRLITMNINCPKKLYFKQNLKCVYFIFVFLEKILNIFICNFLNKVWQQLFDAK